jgi:hypothetical protein
MTLKNYDGDVDVMRLPCAATAVIVLFFVACKVAFAFYVIICFTVDRKLIEVKYFVVFIVLMQPTCNIFH